MVSKNPLGSCWVSCGLALGYELVDGEECACISPIRMREDARVALAGQATHGGGGALCACHVPHVIRKLVEIGSVTGFPKGVCPKLCLLTLPWPLWGYGREVDW